VEKVEWKQRAIKVMQDSELPRGGCMTAGLIGQLASLRLTPWALGLLLIGSAAILLELMPASPAVVPGLLLLSLNLAAALWDNPRFRAQTALLVFHLALLSIVLLAAVGQLVQLKGYVEVAEGMQFSGELDGYSTLGPWHRLENLANVRFASDVVWTDRDLGRPNRSTYNRVTWIAPDGTQLSQVATEREPVVIDSYRFYITSNRGYTPTFVWSPLQGDPVRGAVNLPAESKNPFSQARGWQLPGTGREVWAMRDPDTVSDAGPRPAPEEQRLILRIGEARHAVLPGQAVALPEGALRYEGLRRWMGFQVYYDWTRPWMLAASLVAVLALGWHFLAKYRRSDWQTDRDVELQGATGDPMSRHTDQETA